MLKIDVLELKIWKEMGNLPVNIQRICHLEEKGEESGCFSSTKFVDYLFLSWTLKMIGIKKWVDR